MRADPVSYPLSFFPLSGCRDFVLARRGIGQAAARVPVCRRSEETQLHRVCTRHHRRPGGGKVFVFRAERREHRPLGVFPFAA